MKSVKLLIDLAAEKCHGNYAELARRSGIKESNLSAMRSGARPISAETAAALCDILELPGEEAREWIALAIIENPKNASKAEMLRRALFACWVLGVGSLAMPFKDAQAHGMGWNAAAVTSTTETPSQNYGVTSQKLTQYTLSRMVYGALRRLLALMARAVQPWALAA